MPFPVILVFLEWLICFDKLINISLLTLFFASF